MGTSPVQHHHHEPQAIDTHTSRAGLRTVAVFEALKGVGVILLLIALFMVHSRIEDYAEDLLYNLHIDFDRTFARDFLRAASRLNDSRLWAVATAALLYVCVRFVEAWGLWNRRVWAEWFALLSGCLYLPLEILKVIERVTWQHLAVLLINLIIIFYMAYVRISEARAKD